MRRSSSVGLGVALVAAVLGFSPAGLRVAAQTTTSTKPSTTKPSSTKPSSKPTAVAPSTITGTSASGTKTNVELILDASGSMYAELPAGGTRIEAAKSVLSNFISKLPNDPNLAVGLRVYGASVAAGKQGACQDTKLVLPIRGVDRVALNNTVIQTRPKGATPIALSLAKAAEDFPKDQSRKLVVLVTDGIESCDGDVKQAVKTFADRGIVVDLRIIGIALDAAAQKSFDGVGTFENATSAEALAAAITAATKGISTAVEQKVPVSVSLTSGGKPLTTGPTVTFVSTVGSKTRVSFSTTNGIYQAQVAPGTYVAEVQPAGAPLITVAGLTVAVGSPNTFRFEVGQVAPVTIGFTPQQPTAGGNIKVTYSGAPTSSTKDWIAVAKKADPDAKYSIWQPVKGASGSIELTVPDVTVPLELRYMLVNPDGSTRVIGRSAPFTPKRTPVTLTAPDTAIAGSQIQVSWTGPNNDLDYITIVKKGAPAGTFLGYQYTTQGNPVTLKLPAEPGAFEIRYSNDASRLTLASRPITLTAGTYAVSGPTQAVAGSEISIKWTGPNNGGDYVTIVAKGSPEGTFTDYKYTKQGNPLAVVTPVKPGDYELRYSSDDSRKTLASQPIKLIAGTYALDAPAEAKAGSSIQVKWTGPNSPRDYVTIVPKGAPAGTFTDYRYTSQGNPLTIVAPSKPGLYELRYTTDAGDKPILASRPITIK
jgi:Ca-activated chloride channel homolog